MVRIRNCSLAALVAHAALCSCVAAANITAVGANGTILYQTSGTSVLQPQTGPTNVTLRDVAFDYPGIVGFAVGDAGTIIHTSNVKEGNWQLAVSGTSESLFGAAWTFTESIGWAVGNAGTMLTTGDGGATWTPQVSGTTVALRDVSFDLQGVNVGLAVGDQGTILRSGNGGMSWESRPSGTSVRLNGVAIVNATAWAVGDGGTILRSVNAGIDWSLVPSGTASNLNDVAVILDNNVTGIVVGDGGTALRTQNNGASWSPTVSGTSEDLLGIAYTGGVGYAVGTNGTVLISGSSSSQIGVFWQTHSSGTIEDLYDVTVPEPSTTVLWSLAAVGLALIRARNGIAHRRQVDQ